MFHILLLIVLSYDVQCRGKTTFKDTRSSSRVVKYKQRNRLHANYKLPFKDNFVLEGILLEQMHNYAVPSCNYAIKCSDTNAKLRPCSH